MPMDRTKYPPDWEEISLAVRARAKWKCEFCGAAQGEPHPVTGSRVVLTVAHLDHDTTHNGLENLRALCQRCHLTYDAQLHAQHARETRRKRLLEAGQMELGYE